MHTIEVVLFDYDGTLRDTESLIYESLAYGLNAFGIAMPSKAELAPYIHHHVFVRRQFAPNVSDEDFEAVYYKRKNELLPHIQLFDDVIPALKQLKKIYRLGLVTAAPSTDLDLGRLGLEGMFDVVIGGDQLTEHKPSPQGIRKALAQLDVAPAQAVYVGDMPTDMQAGQAAELAAVIGVDYGFTTPAELKSAGATTVIHSLTELSALLDKPVA